MSTCQTKTRAFNKESTSTVTKIFELIHYRICDPLRTPTHSKQSYFLTIVDDFSRCTSTYLLQHKSDVSTVFPQFLAMVKNQFNTTIKRFALITPMNFYLSSYFKRWAYLTNSHAFKRLNKILLSKESTTNY